MQGMGWGELVESMAKDRRGQQRKNQQSNTQRLPMATRMRMRQEALGPAVGIEAVHPPIPSILTFYHPPMPSILTLYHPPAPSILLLQGKASMAPTGSN